MEEIAEHIYSGNTWENRYPFGNNANGKPIHFSELTSEHSGSNCNLACPECGCPMLLIIHRTGEDAGKPWYLKHAPNTGKECSSEGAAHLGAKRALLDSVGEYFTLPAIRMRDGFPHISRKYYKSQYRKHPERFSWIPKSEYNTSSKAEESAFLEEISCKIIDVQLESSDPDAVPGSKTADAVVLLELPDRRHSKLAIEFSDTHPKDIQDIRAYAENGNSVIEIDISGFDAMSNDFLSKMKKRVLGTECTQNSLVPTREWLYNHRLGKINGEHLFWKIVADRKKDPEFFQVLAYYAEQLGLNDLIVDRSSETVQNEINAPVSITSGNNRRICEMAKKLSSNSHRIIYDDKLWHETRVTFEDTAETRTERNYIRNLSICLEYSEAPIAADEIVCGGYLDRDTVEFFVNELIETCLEQSRNRTSECIL